MGQPPRNNRLSVQAPARIVPKAQANLVLIPANRQKNGRDQTVPTIPAFALQLEETPEDQRTGFVFNPGRERGQGRYKDVKRVGKIITAIGKTSGVIVNTKGKPASAHDLRRSFGQRLADAGVPPQQLQSIMQHSRLETTEKQYLKHDAADQTKRLAEHRVPYPVIDSPPNGGLTQLMLPPPIFRCQRSLRILLDTKQF